ncbi:MAG: hypothetical protein FJ096_05305 [Deltaproteobacteria bacterium]|nr:hypothetical protein [Deltaproteobacteria bacterium]
MKLHPFLGVLALVTLSPALALAEEGGDKAADPAKKDGAAASEGAKAPDEKTDEAKSTDPSKAGDDTANEESKTGANIIKVGLGGLFLGGANFLDKPSDQSIGGRTGAAADPKYPGFAGSSFGGGGFIDVRFIDYVGFEFGVVQMTDKGNAELTITNLGNGAQATFDVKLSQPALHMPLLLKVAIPGVIAQPIFFVGPEFVVPLASCRDDDATRKDKPECQAEVVSTSGGGSLGTKYGIVNNNYISVMFGLGAEFKLPIPKVDVRLPLTLRGAVNSGVSSKRDDRELNDVDAVSGVINRVEYRSEWKFEAYGSLGASIHF